LNKGISGDDDDLSKRKNAFGTNTYPRKKGRSLWVCDIFNFFSFEKVNIVELIPVLVLILYSCFTEVSMGSLAGSDPYYIDYSSCSIISTWSI